MGERLINKKTIPEISPIMEVPLTISTFIPSPAVITEISKMGVANEILRLLKLNNTTIIPTKAIVKDTMPYMGNFFFIILIISRFRIAGYFRYNCINYTPIFFLLYIIFYHNYNEHFALLLVFSLKL